MTLLAFLERLKCCQTLAWSELVSLRIFLPLPWQTNSMKTSIIKRTNNPDTSIVRRSIIVVIFEWSVRTAVSTSLVHLISMNFKQHDHHIPRLIIYWFIVLSRFSSQLINNHMLYEYLISMIYSAQSLLLTKIKPSFGFNFSDFLVVWKKPGQLSWLQ